jgi:hypothetical protein
MLTLLMVSGPAAFGQWTITFDGPPWQPPGTSYGIAEYYEEGVWFRAMGPLPTHPPYRLGRSGGSEEFFADNGTAYLFADAFGSLVFSQLRGWSSSDSPTNWLPYGTGARFGLVSVDLAEFSVLYAQPWTVHFDAYRPDGSRVSVDFTTDGIIDGTGPLADFQTFHFDSRFRDVIGVEVPTMGWSLDNLVLVAVIPEPGTAALLLCGAVVFAGRAWRCAAMRPETGQKRVGQWW